ncbi:MAG: ATP-binding protein, partial [Anaerolineae bacterium]|nr:ATP-binding protein [Anaerolineae bacterium]
PYQHIKSNILPNRTQLEGQEDILHAVDRVLTQLGTQKPGGLVMLEGGMGAGKTRLLDILRAEIRSLMPAMLIHLRGSSETRYEPFGVLREWLPADTISAAAEDVQERQRTYLAAFHQRVLDYLRIRPVLLVVDDVHLLDTASLQALQSIFPLMAQYPLILLMAARPSGRWQKMMYKVQRALGEKAVRIALPAGQPFIRDSWPEDLTAQRVLECAAVLGREFPVKALRRMLAVSDVTRYLMEFQQEKILIPTDDPLIWRFVHVEERDRLYRRLTPVFAALLHGYAWSALKTFQMPTHAHAHEAELHNVALPEGLQKLARVRYFDTPHEALVCYEEALMHQPSHPVSVNLMMGRVEMQLELGMLEEAEQTLRLLNRKNNLTDEQYARLLYFQGELLRRLGEIAPLFKIYSNALAYLRAEAPTPAMINLQVDLLYALAMAHFRNREIEIARSLLGTAIFKSEQVGLPYQLARLWMLLAQMHQTRTNYQQAWKAIRKTLEVQEKLGYRYSTAETHLLAGNLQEMMGSLSKARDHYQQALARFEETGSLDSALHVRLRLAQGALHEGMFDLMTEHLEAALQLAAFSESMMLRVQIHSTYAEGLALQGYFVAAFEQANLGIDLARRFGEKLAMCEGYLALAKVGRAAHWWNNAKDAVDHALQLLPAGVFALLRLRVIVTLMEILLAQDEMDAFMKAYSLTRDINPTPGDELVRARLNLLIGRYRLKQENWNMAAVEVEKAYRTFTRLGASYWLPEARDLLREIMDKFHAEVA